MTTKRRETKSNGYSLTLPILSILHSVLLYGSIWNDIFNDYSPKVCFCFGLFGFVFVLIFLFLFVKEEN